MWIRQIELYARRAPYIRKHAKTARQACHLLKKYGDGDLLIDKSSESKIGLHMVMLSAALTSICKNRLEDKAVNDIKQATVDENKSDAAKHDFIGLSLLIISELSMVVMRGNYNMVKYDQERKYADDTIKNLKILAETTDNERVRDKANRCIEKLERYTERIERGFDKVGLESVDDSDSDLNFDLFE